MKDMKPKEFAKMGEFYLEKAILDVLLDMKYRNQCIGAAEISRKSGIYREPGEIGLNDAIVSGMLNKLYDEQKVNRCPLGEKKGWELTDEEFSKRKDDRND